MNETPSNANSNFKSSYLVGITLHWNLFDGGADYANQRQRALASGMANERLGQLEKNIPVNFEEAKRRFSYDVLNYRAKLVSIRKAEEAVRLARGGVKAGTLTNTDVLDAVLDLNRARAAAIRSQIDAIDALGQLELSVGHAI
jgi:outer membrane protein TolC